MNAIPESTVAEDRLLAPLVFFYGIGGVRPRVTFVNPEELPPTEHHLLVHEHDMTPHLRDYHHSPIDLDVHAKAVLGHYLVRASVLTRRSDGMPVEFGAIGIWLDALPEDARQPTRDGSMPFGAILEKFEVPHESHPQGYFRIAVDARLAELLGATPGQILFGRCNQLRTADGTALADVVEVLPRSSGSSQ